MLFGKKNKNKEPDMKSIINDNIPEELRRIFESNNKGKRNFREMLGNAEKRKSAIEEELVVLRNMIISCGDPELAPFYDKISDLKFKISRINNSKDLQEMAVVDMCILLSIDECKDYCNRKLAAPIIATLFAIEDWVDNRFRSPEYLKDPSYIGKKLLRQSVYANAEERKAMKFKKSEEGRVLVDLYNKTNSMEKKAEYKRTIDKAKTDIERLNNEIADLEVKIDNYDSMLSIERQRIDNSVNDKEYHKAVDESINNIDDISIKNEEGRRIKEQFNQFFKTQDTKSTEVNSSLVMKDTDNKKVLPDTIDWDD